MWDVIRSSRFMALFSKGEEVVVLILCVGRVFFFFTTDHMASHLKCNHQVTMYVENHRDQKHSGVIIGASIRLVIVANHLWKMVGNLASMHGKRPTQCN